MNQDEIDRILSSEDEILPSSGFAASVLDAVRRDAATPPPIPFPWKRAWPVAAAAAIALVGAPAAIWYDMARRAAAGSGGASAWASSIEALARTAGDSGAHWLILAAALTLASVAASKRLAAGRA